MGRVGGWGELNVTPGIPYSKILLVTLNSTTPQNVIKIGPKLPELVI